MFTALISSLNLSRSKISELLTFFIQGSLVLPLQTHQILSKLTGFSCSREPPQL